MKNEATRLSLPDAISERYAAVPTPSGRAMSMAMADVMIVP